MDQSTPLVGDSPEPALQQGATADTPPEKKKGDTHTETEVLETAAMSAHNTVRPTSSPPEEGAGTVCDALTNMQADAVHPEPAPQQEMTESKDTVANPTHCTPRHSSSPPEEGADTAFEALAHTDTNTQMGTAHPVSAPKQGTTGEGHTATQHTKRTHCKIRHTQAQQPTSRGGR